LQLPKIEGPKRADLPLVVIDPGHGGHDPGSSSSDGNEREKNVALAIARAIRDELVESGRVRVALTRADDRFLILANAAKSPARSMPISSFRFTATARPVRPRVAPASTHCRKSRRIASRRHLRRARTRRI
jgi:N-acetylmuramoyl-L-alanine amidase